MSTSSVLHSKTSDHFGFVSERFSNKKLVYNSNSDKVSTNRNILTIASWIPVIGSIVGLLRICAFWNNNINAGFRRVGIARGVVEVLSLGALFMIPDLIVTIGRMLNPHSSSTWGRRSAEKLI